jgi:hypothetical protein
MRLENLHHFSNLRDNFLFNTICHRWYVITFQFNVIWHTWSMATLVLCWRLATSDVTVIPSVMCMDWLNWLRWWYYHVVDVVRNVNLHHLVQSKWKLAKENQCEREIRHNKLTWKVEQIDEICHNVRLTYSSIHTIRDNADRIKESAKQGLKCWCGKTMTALLEWIVPKTMYASLLHFYCIRNKLIYCTSIYVFCI